MRQPNNLVSDQQKHIIYLATDANRMYIEAGYCEHIAHRLFEMQQASTPLFPGRPKLGRIVYMEEFASFEEAQKRKSELLMYTPMMKERIIRRNNPNWLNIVGTYVNANKKAVVYA